MSFPVSKKKILIDSQLSRCNYGCIFFPQAKHGTQIYFIIQKTGSFQRWLTSLVRGIFNVFFLFRISAWVQCVTVCILCLWSEGAANPETVLVGRRGQGLACVWLVSMSLRKVSFQTDGGPVPWAIKARLSELLAICPSAFLPTSAISPPLPAMELLRCQLTPRSSSRVRGEDLHSSLDTGN